MKYVVRGHLNIARSQPVTAPGSTTTSAIAAPTARRDVMMRNFILQQGFADPAPAVRRRQYAALTFQPRIPVEE